MADASLKRAQMIALLLPAALLGGAYVSQYGFGLYPCEMCWWQRWPHFAAVPLALVSFVAAPKRLLIGLAGLAILISGLIGGFHAGVEYSWWEGITGCALPPVAADGGSALDAIMEAPLVRCDAAPWDLFGISLAGWNFLVSCAGALAIFALLARSKKA
jgi:disulfide bond formation protein DsbB